MLTIRASLIFLVLLGFSLSGKCADWPHWRGVDRNDVTGESSGYAPGKTWPPPPAIWKTNVGHGASSPLAVGDLIFTYGREKSTGQFVLRALEAKTGLERWRQSHPGPDYGRFAVGDQGFFSGATATPEYDPVSGLLFTLSCDGDLRAWDTENGGKPVWNLNFYDKFGMGRRPQITKRKNTLRDYGYTCAPFVYRDLVIVEVGDPRTGNLHAFDKKTGQSVWRSQNRDVAGHSGAPALMQVDGVDCLAIATSYHALVVRLDGKNAGKTVAEFPWATDFSNTIAGIAARGNEFLIASRYNQDAMVKVAVSLRGGAREIWRNKYPTGVCTPVIFEDRIYFANKGIHCVDFKTGRLLWEGGRIGDAGSCLVTSDEKLMVWGNGGDLSLVETAKHSPGAFKLLAEKKNVLKERAWPHLVLANGRILCKTTDGNLVCFSLSGESPMSSPKKSDPSVPKVRDWNFSNWDELKTDGLLWSWKQGDGQTSRSALARRARLEPRGDAAFSDDGAMQLSGGAWLLQGVSPALYERCRKSNELTLELVFQSASLNQSGPARIVSFSKDGYQRNFSLCQERENLVLRVRTTRTGDNGIKPESKLLQLRSPLEITSVTVTFGKGNLVAYQQGKAVYTSKQVSGDFSNWVVDFGLLFGDELPGEGSRNWEGRIFAVAFFDRALSAEEVATRYRALVE